MPLISCKFMIFAFIHFVSSSLLQFFHYSRFCSVWDFLSRLFVISSSSFSLVFLSPFITFIICLWAISEGIVPILLFTLSPTFLHLVWAVTPPSPASFPSDGAVLVQTWAAQRLVARAHQYGALGGCVSLSPHLWDGLRLPVVSTPPPVQDHMMKVMSTTTK